MSDLIKKLDASWIRGLVTILIVIAVIVGFFQGLIPAEFFKDTLFLIIGFYFGKGSPSKREGELEKELQGTK